jgi:multicomponent Na+:H+ antiporter subunit B
VKPLFGSVVLDVACRLPVPFIILFAIYVIVHGHDSPGGGFQGGTILAATFILIRMIRQDVKPWGLDRTGALVLACCGLLLYTGIGLLSFLFAGNYLDYGVLPLPLEAGKIRFMGSFGIEVGVSMSVTGVLVLIFDALTEGASHDDQSGQPT